MDRRPFLKVGSSVGVGAALAAHPLSVWVGRPAPSAATGRRFAPVAGFTG